MGIKARIYLLILIFFSGVNLPLISSISSYPIELKSKVGLDYLKITPSSEYIFGPGDDLLVIVSRDYPELNSTVNIDGEGYVFLPKIKRVYVSGLTKSELITLLNEAYKEFVKFPNVEINIVNYRPLRVLVKGEVENPGLHSLNGSFLYKKENRKFPFSSTLNRDSDKYLINNRLINQETPLSFVFPTVFDAIQESGGITEYADITKVEVIRQDTISNGGGQIKTELDFEDLINNGNNEQNIRIYDSDTIIVNKTKYPNNKNLRKAIVSNLNPKFVDVYVSGRVKNPGKLTITKQGSVRDAIEMAGVTGGLKGPVKFIRFNNDGSVDKRKFSFPRNRKNGSYKNPTLKNGDIIIVENTFVSSTSNVINELTSPFVGIFSTYGLYKAISD